MKPVSSVVITAAVVVVVTGAEWVTTLARGCLTAAPIPTPRQMQIPIGMAMLNTQTMQPTMEVTTIAVTMVDASANMKNENHG